MVLQEQEVEEEETGEATTHSNRETEVGTTRRIVPIIITAVGKDIAGSIVPNGRNIARIRTRVVIVLNQAIR